MVPSNALARPQDVNSLVTGWLLPQKGTLSRLLPADTDVDTFLGTAAAAMHKNPSLAQAAMKDPASLMIALREAARLGHLPGTDRYALTIREGKILGMEQYQGVVARMFNAGAVTGVHAEVVCRGERFERRDPLPPIHEPVGGDWFARDTKVENLVGVYAYATLDTGSLSRIVVMGRAEVMAHRAAAATTKIWDGPFGKSMWLKTAAHELEKWVPVSAEYRRQQGIRDAAAAALSAPVPPPAAPQVPEDAPGAQDGAQGVGCEHIWRDNGQGAEECQRCGVIDVVE